MPNALKYLAAFILSAAIGFGVVYLSRGGLSNAPQTSRPAPPASGSPSAPRSALAAFARGDMAAFVAKEPAPLPAIAMVDQNGKALSLGDWRGRTVLLNLWATWCAPCLKEMPALDRLKAALAGEAFDVVALNIDKGTEKPKAFLEKAGIRSLAFLHDQSGKVFVDLGSSGMPTTLLIDAKGREIGRLVGPAEWDGADAKALIRAALGKPAP
jgi:thiol-disulfide isomerase/thioredoxin